MKQWYQEEWCFVIEVLQVGEDDQPEACRVGLEPGDTFECAFATPAKFCPTAFIKLFPSMEVVRCGGDLRILGGEGPAEATFVCPDGVVRFRLLGERRSEKVS
ncbi:MAG: TIGR04076 family protein [Anaerolineae bacterium]